MVDMMRAYRLYSAPQLSYGALTLMAETSLKNLSVSFAKPKQSRAKDSLNNLVEAAEKIVATGDASGFNARTLAKVSGYSLGALVQRLGKVENIFLHAIAFGRTKQLEELAQQIESFGSDKTADQYAEFLVDIALSRIPVVGAQVIRYYESRAMGRTNNVSNIHAYTDEMIPTLTKILAQDETGTFRKVSAYEMKYLARSIFHIIERPFAEGDPDAGSAAHRAMAIHHISRLLSAV